MKLIGEQILTFTLAGLLLILTSPPTEAAPPTWLRLLQPENGRLSIDAGIGSSFRTEVYPELWRRKEKQTTERRFSINFHHRIGETPSAIEMAFDLGIAALERDCRESEYALNPTGIAYSQRRLPHYAQASLLLGWQMERLLPLGRFGFQVGSNLSSQSSIPQFSLIVWGGRVYEPVVLSASFMKGFQKDKSTGAQLQLGVEMAVSPKISLAATAFEVWPGDSERKNPLQMSAPRLGLEAAVNIRSLDRSGWRIGLQLEKGAHRMGVKRYAPLP